jgi:hypothetical protein
MGCAGGAVRCAKCGRPMYHLCIPRMSGDRGPSVSRQARPSQSNETPVGPIAGAVRVDPSRRRTARAAHAAARPQPTAPARRPDRVPPIPRSPVCMTGVSRLW